MDIFTFNSKTSPAAKPNDAEANLLFLRYQERYLTDLLRARGYIYLNRIYEALGVKWNPEWRNLCMLWENDAKVELAIRGVNEDGFDLDISII